MGHWKNKNELECPTQTRHMTNKLDPHGLMARVEKLLFLWKLIS